MFLSLIAYSNGVDESWKAGIVHWIHWFIPKLFQSAIVPRASVHRVGVLFAFWYMFACLMSIALLFPSFVH